MFYYEDDFDADYEEFDIRTLQCSCDPGGARGLHGAATPCASTW